jgi:hypothetical protein
MPLRLSEFYELCFSQIYANVGELVFYTTTTTIAAHTVARGVPQRIYHWRLEGLESGSL